MGKTMLWIGALSLAGGSVALLALTNGDAAKWAILAVVCAGLAAAGPSAMRLGASLLAAAFALFCLDAVLNGNPMWLTTLGIVVGVLGVAALINFARTARKAPAEPSKET